MLEKYRELDIVVCSQSEHHIDLLSEMQKVPVYFLSTTCEVDISAHCRMTWNVRLLQLFTKKQKYLSQSW
jgi:hypothetical protein